VDGLTIRPARSADAPAIAAIHNEGIADRSATFETEPRTPAGVAERPGTHPLLVAERGGRVVGFARAEPYSSRPAYAGVVECAVYVQRPARGSGIGARLLDALAADCEARGFHKLVGKLFATNRHSAALVLGRGFREVGVHRRHARLDGRWRDVLVVERLVGAAARDSTVSSAPGGGTRWVGTEGQER
jgi:phosphinothricin acetyltransferase